MTSPGRALASLRFTLVGMIVLAIGAALSYNNPSSTPVWVLVLPLGLLAVNLLAAIATDPRINRRPGLLVFHIALLGIVVLAAVGRLTRFEAHTEMLQGTAFEPEHLSDINQAPLHPGHLDQVTFTQGPYTVDYAPGMMRGRTRSQVWVQDSRGGWDSSIVGDDRPLVLDGYRFYTSYNKGFALILTWTPDGGQAVTGSVNMPSYPMFEYKQDNTWTPPGGQPIKFWLHLATGMRQDGAWVLDARKAQSTLALYSGERRVELRPGESARVPGGILRYEQLSTWMGYKIFYDPTLRWMFMVAVIGVLGLAVHFWRRFAVPVQARAPRAEYSIAVVSPKRGAV